MITAVVIFQTYALFFLEEVVGLENPAQALGNMILAIGGALALTVYPAGWLSDRIGRKPVVLAGAIGAAVGTVGMLSADGAGEVLIIATVIGASVGVLLSASWALANELGTVGREAQHMSIVTIATVRGAALAKMLGPGVGPAQPSLFRVGLLGSSYRLRGPVPVGCVAPDAIEDRLASRHGLWSRFMSFPGRNHVCAYGSQVEVGTSPALTRRLQRIRKVGY